MKLFVPLAGREGEGSQNWDGFWEGIADRLEQQPRKRSGRLIPFPGTIRWVAAAGAVAATALLVGIFLVQQGESPMVPVAVETAQQETVQPAAADDAEGLMESIYIDQIAEALPAQFIERRGEVQALRLTRVDERSSGSVSHYRTGGEPVAATVSDVQLADQMESIIEYSLVISENESGGRG